MSVKLELYNLIKTAIATVTEVETFGKFNNQFNTEDQECPFNNPSVFFEFAEIGWQEQSTQYQNSNSTQQQKSGELQFTLHIGYWSHEDEEDKFLALLELVHKIHIAVTGIQSDNINPIKRLNEIDDSDHTEPIVWRVIYSTMITESGEELNVTPESVAVQVDINNT